MSAALSRRTVTGRSRDAGNFVRNATRVTSRRGLPATKTAPRGAVPFVLLVRNRLVAGPAATREADAREAESQQRERARLRHGVVREAHDQIVVIVVAVGARVVPEQPRRVAAVGEREADRLR